MDKVSNKKNLSSMQVLKTLKILLQGNYTMQELVDILNSQEPEPVFNNSVVSKYINTCRFCGIEIPKIQNKYFVVSIPFGMDFTAKDADLIENLKKSSLNDFTLKQFDIFTKLADKIIRFSNKNIARVDKLSGTNSFEIFERAITNSRTVKLLYKNGNVITGIPIRIGDKNGKRYFNILYKNKERHIDVNRVSGIHATNDKSIQNYNSNMVQFILKGDLARRYELRENETLTDRTENAIIISNHGENPDVLLSRLLRYDCLCEIIRPVQLREKMKKIIKDTLKNYGES